MSEADLTKGGGSTGGGDRLKKKPPRRPVKDADQQQQLPPLQEQKPEAKTPRPNSEYYDDPPEEEIVDVSEGDSEGSQDRGKQQDARGRDTSNTSQEREKSPAYVAPIPKIGKISPVDRISESEANVPAAGRPQIPQFVTANLVGKKIDEYGDVVDEDGTVLGRVAGDLPSMVGRSVLNQRGDVLGDDGELLGYVAEVEGHKAGNGRDTPGMSEAESMDEFMGRQKGGFRVDNNGNILDEGGNIVGSFHDNLRMPPKEKKEPEGDESTKPGDGPEETSSPSPAQPRENAQSHRKENDSPSDIFLDVKSTREGIQLTIRIPTVFPDGREPRVTFT